MARGALHLPAPRRLLTRGAETAVAAFGVAQFIRPYVIANGGAFDDQLRDSLARVETYRGLAGIDDQRLQFTPKITIHYAGEGVNPVARRQSGARRYPPIP